MTIPAQITPAGLLIPTVEELLADLASKQKANVDALIATDSDSVVGEFNGIFASHLREGYEAVQYAYDSIDPDNAEDARLDTVSSITGTVRDGATKSVFQGTNKVTVNLNAGVTLPTGSKAHVVGVPDALFETTEDVTNSGGAPANVLVPMQATVTGAVHANQNTLTEIATPVVGWNSVINAAGDAALGHDVEEDPSLRIRREEELRQAGTSTEPALHSNLLAMVASSDGITKPIISCLVLENDTDAVVDGVPAHGFEAVIWDGVSLAANNTDVAKTIFKCKGLGIPTSGSVSVTITDSAGFPKVIKFSRATQRLTSLTVTLKFNTAYVGDDAVKQALSDAYQGLTQAAQAVGGIVSFSQYMSVVQRLAGVVRIEGWHWRLGLDPFVDFTDLTPLSREVATITTGSIAVVSSSV
jgi:uncharacterized phage protein gp47/JayE